MGESRRSEIFIGLIGAVGVDLDDVAGKLGWALEQARYVPLTVRVSACVAELLGVETDDLDEESRVECLQDAGDRLRTITDNGAAAMFPTIADICRQREANKANNARAYIIKSMKRPEEVQFLRQVYGDRFFAIGCVAPLVKRREYLKRVIQNKAACIKEANDVDRSISRIIARDESDEQNDRGQNVRDTLVLADAIVDAHHENLQSQIDRLRDLMFGSPWETPTLAEYAMTTAAMSALRSQDLSRQVGAAIVDEGNGAIIATGFNEVPVPGGGVAWSLQKGDADLRDRRMGGDQNAFMRSTIFREFVEAMHASDLLKEGVGVADTVQRMLSGDLSKMFKRRRISNLIEFGRIVHAEMAALTEAARTGRSVAGATMYCTTYPCHMCARHLIAAGIARVVYIEPYPKSLTQHLYEGAVSYEGEVGAAGKALRFQAFIGVTPRLYQRVFSLGQRKRKDGAGRPYQWQVNDAMPFIDNSDERGYVENEQAAIAYLSDLVKTVLQDTSGGRHDQHTNP